MNFATILTETAHVVTYDQITQNRFGTYAELYVVPPKDEQSLSVGTSKAAAGFCSREHNLKWCNLETL